MIIHAITLWQPWASLISIGVKINETRGKPCPPRLLGKRIAIHAALRKPRIDEMPFAEHVRQEYLIALPLGAVVCTCVIAYSLPVELVQSDPYGNYSPGRFAWRICDVQEGNAKLGLAL